MNLIKDVGDLASTVWTNVETFFDTQFHAFLTAAMPLYNDLNAFAQATGEADLGTLLTDLKQDLMTGVSTLAVTGGNTGAAIAAVSTQVLGQVKDVTAAAKNAVYGALAIVAADVSQIVGVPRPCPRTLRTISRL
jgi:hypothetical protein